MDDARERRLEVEAEQLAGLAGALGAGVRVLAGHRDADGGEWSGGRVGSADAVPYEYAATRSLLPG